MKSGSIQLLLPVYAFTIEETNNGSEPCIDELGVWSTDKKSVTPASKRSQGYLCHLEITKAIPNISWFISMMGDLNDCSWIPAPKQRSVTLTFSKP